MNYKSVNTLSALLEVEADLFFIDLEETILQPNIYYEMISYLEYKDLFNSIRQMGSSDGGEISEFDLKYMGKNFKRKLIEKKSPSIIAELRAAGKKVFALTSGFPSKQKKDKLRKLNVIFDGFLFTKGTNKGPFLINFLEQKKLEGTCCFIDNDLGKILNVGNAFLEKYNEERKIELLLFHRTIVHNISKSSFIAYWKGVVFDILAGNLDKLRQEELAFRYKKYNSKKAEKVEDF